MIDQRTKDVCKNPTHYPNAPSFREHQEFLLKCSMSLYKSFLNDVKRMEAENDILRKQKDDR